MHKNAIKNVRGVKYLEILAKNSVFFPCFGAFYLVLFVFFWSDIRVFQEKSSGNTGFQVQNNNKTKTFRNPNVKN